MDGLLPIIGTLSESDSSARNDVRTYGAKADHGNILPIFVSLHRSQ
jgi:hypothetical protein